MSKSWSPLQMAIFELVSHGSGNAIINAVAGSGKSSTIVEAMKGARGSTIFLAFNKAIAEELKAKGVNARTFHSLTYSPVCQSRGVRQVDMDKLRNLCRANMTGDDLVMYGSFAQKLVGLARQVGIGCLVPDTEQSWMDIVVYHDLEPDNEMADLGRGIELAQQLLEWSNAAKSVDFDDMLYLSVKDGISLPKFDFIFVDEAQDTNAIQRAILRKIMRPGARLIAVGDPGQAIYGFRGADSNSMDRLAEDFDCKELPLSITYRCPKAVVRYAQQWVPSIQAADTASEGVVKDLGHTWKLDVMSAGDLVVCRKTAPLINLAYRFLRAAKPVTVMGREIGAGLKSLVNKMNARSVDMLVERLGKYQEREVEKALAKQDDAKAEAVADKVGSLLVLVESLTENHRTVAALLNRIDELFSNKAGAVILATIHKSKGLEADNVFWLGRSECPAKWARQQWQKQQEVNLCYVAATRAKKALYLIEMGD
jgi:DNA helicase-2/ATP-dependent DNA helicase PcrA